MRILRYRVWYQLKFSMARRNYSIYDIIEFSNTKESTIYFLQARHLIHSNVICTWCGQILKLSELSKNINIGYILKCINKACRYQQSLIARTFFHRLHFPLQKYIAVYYCASQGQFIVDATPTRRRRDADADADAPIVKYIGNQ